MFEATLHWTVLSGSTTVRTGVTSTAEGQTFAPFRFSLDLPPGRYTVRISEDDPSDGAGRPVLTDDRTVTSPEGCRTQISLPTGPVASHPAAMVGAAGRSPSS